MSLSSFFQERPASTPPARPALKMRRRLIGRSKQLRAAGLAAGVLSLGLAFGQPAQAGVFTWDGATADWFSNPSHWVQGGYPGAGDDAQNNTVAAMTLGQNESVNSFISDGAFSLLGGTFSGSTGAAGPDTPDLHNLQINNVFTIDGGQVNNFTVNQGVQQANQPAPSVVVTGNNNNYFINSIVNANVDASTHVDAYLGIQGTVTETKNISLGTTSNGLRLVYDGANLTLSNTGSLTGFGNVYQYSNTTLTNNGLINANSAGNLLSLGLTTFNNNAGATAEATAAGSTLNLSNATTTNDGKLIATGGGTVNLTSSTTLQSNADGSINSQGGTVNVQGVNLLGTINGVGTSALTFDSNNNNYLNGTAGSVISNINLDASTHADAYLGIQGTVTETKNISLGTTSNGLRLVYDGANLTLSNTGSLTGFGNVYQYSNTTLTNNGLINANSAGNLLSLGLTTFNNNAGATAEATAAGSTLNLSNATTTNDGKLIATGGGTVNLTSSTTLQSNADGSINSQGGTVNVQGVNLLGTINGVGTSALTFDSNNNNYLNGTAGSVISNINLDASTHADAYLGIQGTVTETKNISLGTTSNGLRLVYDGANLTLGSTGSLTGFGNVYQYSNTTLTNNGTVNATNNGQVTPQTLNLALTTFNNNGLAEATGGATLALNNINSNLNDGSTLKADGIGSMVSLAGVVTGAGNNLITAIPGGQVQANGVALRGTLNTDASTAIVVNSSGNNSLDNTTINGNLDMATHSDAYLQLFDANTVNGNINLGTTNNGLRLVYDGANLTLGSTGSLTGFGSVYQYGNTTLTNNGTVNANVAGQTLSLTTTNFVNTGTTEVQNGAALHVTSANTDSGNVNVVNGGTATFDQGLDQTAGVTTADGTLNSNLTLDGGVLQGNGHSANGGGVFGNVVNNAGTVVARASLDINGNFTQNSGGTLEVDFNNSTHSLLTVSGLTTTGGILDVNFVDPNNFTGGVGSTFAFLDYNQLGTPLTSNGFEQYFLNETPTSDNAGTIMGQNGFEYMLINDTADKQLQLEVTQAGSPVPEASTTVSFGLLLALGLGGVVVSARRRKASASL